MKTYLIAVILVLSSSLVFGQMGISIDSLRLIPAQPGPNDTFRLISYMTSPTSSYVLLKSKTQTSGIIVLDVCARRPVSYVNASTPFSIIDTFLPTGIQNVKIVVNAKWSIDSPCNPMFFAKDSISILNNPNGIEEIWMRNVSISPNPVLGNEVIVSNLESNAVISASNVLGQPLPVRRSGNKLLIGDWPRGLYLLRVRDGERQQVVRLLRE